ncbi:MAG: hypothetical protein AB7S26_22140 [Sandaracinaceae bacterium]
MRIARYVAVGVTLLASGCVSDRSIELAIEPPRDAMGGPMIPADVLAWEVRVSRLGDEDECPGLEASAAARAFGELAVAESFGVNEPGHAIGELPSGRWAFAAIARDVDCAPLLYGCAIARLESGVETPIVIAVESVNGAPGCGCRACAMGECDPVASVCE